MEILSTEIIAMKKRAHTKSKDVIGGTGKRWETVGMPVNAAGEKIHVSPEEFRVDVVFAPNGRDPRR
jgi:hypothetical protein